MTITIRKCTLADIPALQAISRETFADTFGSENSPEDLANYLDESYSQAQLKQELQDPNSEFYFAYDDDQLAAYLKVNVGDSQTEEMGKNAFEIQRIYVL
ncbi:GNAT family N-acetyltransferase, partial [Lactobacillus parabuchneri]|nr:GNAT family N-acetyltransferase [Lentilactobacillus parabuchneri]